MNFFSVRRDGQIFNSLLVFAEWRDLDLSRSLSESGMASLQNGWKSYKTGGEKNPKIKHLAIAEATMINYLPCQGLQEENHRTASSKNELVL